MGRSFRGNLKLCGIYSRVGEYINTKTKILCECKRCGHQWMVMPYSVLHGTGCPKCAGNIKKTQEEFEKELKEISPEITVIYY